MSQAQGKFIWYDLMTSDTAAAETFYKNVVGWDAKDSGVPGVAYTVLSMAGAGVGGLMAVPEDARKMGARPGWLGYVGVADVDAATAQVKQAGGAEHRPPADIPGVGRFSVVADPQGASFMLFTPKGEGMMPPAPPGAPGHIGWHELQSSDPDAALKFYSGMFGWTKSDAMDMGPMGTYQIFAIDGAQAGGMMRRMPEVPVSFWLYYINVAAIDAAVTRIKDNGGAVLHGPVEVPGGNWIVQARDPQGAMFALVGPKG